MTDVITKALEKLMFRLHLYAALILTATPAFAQTACDRPHNDFDGLYCLNKVYQQADHDLNGAYGQLPGWMPMAGAH